MLHTVLGRSDDDGSIRIVRECRQTERDSKVMRVDDVAARAHQSLAYEREMQIAGMSAYQLRTIKLITKGELSPFEAS